MQIAGALLVLFGSIAAVKIYAHGYCNTVEGVALWLKRHARDVRDMHTRKSKQMNEEWQRELEAPHSREEVTARGSISRIG